MPATVLVDEKNEMTRNYGDCSQFLSIPVGEATFDIFMLLRNDLKIPVSTVLRDARTKDERVIYADVPVMLDEKPEYITVVAQPITDRHGQPANCTAISFIREKRIIEGDIKEFQKSQADRHRARVCQC